MKHTFTDYNAAWQFYITAASSGQLPTLKTAIGGKSWLVTTYR